MIRQKGHLKPSKMIPSLVVSNRSAQEVEAIRYLEFCIEERGKGGLGTTDAVIHNFLLSLYVKHQRGKVLEYLDKQFVPEKRAIPGDDDAAAASVVFDRKKVYFDVNYVLRLCSQPKEAGASAVSAQLRRACVLLHCMLGQLDQAVELALEDGDLEQAKFCLKIRTVNSGTDDYSGKS